MAVAVSVCVSLSVSVCLSEFSPVATEPITSVGGDGVLGLDDGLLRMTGCESSRISDEETFRSPCVSDDSSSLCTLDRGTSDDLVRPALAVYEGVEFMVPQAPVEEGGGLEKLLRFSQQQSTSFRGNLVEL